MKIQISELFKHRQLDDQSLFSASIRKNIKFAVLHFWTIEKAINARE